MDKVRDNQLRWFAHAQQRQINALICQIDMINYSKWNNEDKRED